jgi:hypothetical protein
MSDVDVPPLDLLAQINNAVYPAFATLAGIQLGLFRAMLAGPMSSQALATALGVDEYKLKPLLDALPCCTPRGKVTPRFIFYFY